MAQSGNKRALQAEDPQVGGGSTLPGGGDQMTAPSVTAREAVQIAEDGSRIRVSAIGRPPRGRESVTVEPKDPCT
jgi:hypothetical protein